MGQTPDARLKVHMLGPLCVEVGGTEIPVKRWKSKKALALLKYLVAKQGARVAKDVLIQLLWPDEDAGPETEHRLHVTVYHLRRTLEPERSRYEESAFIGHSDGLYWFISSPDCWVDAVHFERLCSQGRSAEAGDPQQALEFFEQAQALYRGDFLAEDVYEDWAASLRERYRELFVDMSLRAARLMAAVTADYFNAVRVLRAALASDPYSEELHQAVMTHLIGAGRYAEAAIFYRDYTQLLYKEFGLSPSPDLKALYNELRKVARVPEVEVPSAEGVKGPPASGAFVCDRATFESVYRLEIRRQGRDGEPLTLITATASADLDSKNGTTVLNILAGQLRQGDVLCRWDARRFMVQLPRTGAPRSAVIKRRLVSTLSTATGLDFALEVQVLEPFTSDEKLGRRDE